MLLQAAVPAKKQAQEPAKNQQDAIEKQVAAISAKMQASLARQRQAVQKQAKIAEIPEGSFFVLPFPPPPPPPALPECDPIPDVELTPLIQEASKREALRPELLRAVIKQESAFRPCAVSEKGAMGLMQLMPETVDQLRVQDPFDPRENLDAGAKYLKQLFLRYSGDLALALAAYNAGPAKVDASRTVPAIPETENYVKQIMAEVSR